MNSILLPRLSYVTYGCAWQCSVTLPTFPWGFPVYGQKHLWNFLKRFLPVGNKQIYALNTWRMELEIANFIIII